MQRLLTPSLAFRKLFFLRSAFEIIGFKKPDNTFLLEKMIVAWLIQEIPPTYIHKAPPLA
jgi:hypothetical protein